MTNSSDSNKCDDENPEPVSPEGKALIEALKLEQKEFEKKPDRSLFERVQSVSESLRVKGFSVDGKALAEYFRNIGEAGYEGGKTGVMIGNPKTAIIGVKAGLLAGIFGVKASRIRDGRVQVFDAAGDKLKKTEEWVRSWFRGGDKPDEPGL